MSLGWELFDPGECPICQTPHCACTSPDYVPAVADPSPAAAVSTDAPEKVTFTTKTYRRGMLKRPAKSAPA